MIMYEGASASVNKCLIWRFNMSNLRPPRPCQSISTPNLCSDKWIPPGLCLEARKASLMIVVPTIHTPTRGPTL